MDAETERRWSGGRRAVAALALFVLVCVAYAPGRVSGGYNLADPLLVVPTTLSLLRDGDLELGEFADEVDPGFYGLLLLDGRPYNRYPVGASLVILPLVWLAGPPEVGETRMTHALRIADPVAKVIAAVSVVLLFLLLLEVTGRPRRSLALAAIFAFATPHFPTHAGALWTHNVAMPLVLAALLLVVVRDGRWAASAALPLALAFVTRPTTAIAIVLVTAYVALRLPRRLPAYATIGATAAVLFGAWSWHMYGTVLPPYYLGFHNPGAERLTPGVSSKALLGHLVSPNRGLFVFAPVFLFSLWGMVRVYRGVDRHAALYRAVALGIVAHWLLISSIQRGWWGGWCFGPRHFMDVVPLLVLLLSPALDGLARLSRGPRAGVSSLAALAVAWGLFVAVRGATSFAPHGWNRTPIPVPRAPERVWDWSDLQVLRGLGRG